MVKHMMVPVILLFALMAGTHGAQALTVPGMGEAKADNGSRIHLMAGIDESALGIIARDARLGLPRWSLGVNFALGLTYRFYVPVVKGDEVERASLEAMVTSGGDEREVRALTRRNLDKKLFPYFGVVTNDRFIPGAVGGVSYDMSNAEGRGWSFNAEVVSHPLARMLPIPTVGFNYSF